MKAVTQLKTPYNQSISENMLARKKLGMTARLTFQGMWLTWKLSCFEQGINQLQQVEIIEIAKCNLDRIPPSLEEPCPESQRAYPCGSVMCTGRIFNA